MILSFFVVVARSFDPLLLETVAGMLKGSFPCTRREGWTGDDGGSVYTD